MKCNGTLLALHPDSSKGVLLKYENISNCFHLFSLLQAAIGLRIPGGHVPDLATIAVAKGTATTPVTDAAWWHYGDPRSPRPDINASIWGEASPRTVPYIDDVQVILLWPPVLASRSWDGGFFHPHLDALPSDVLLERELSTSEARAWIDRLKLEAPKRWWRFW